MKVIFMGTPEFAVPALKKLIDDENIEIVAVYSREPQIAGRGHKVTNSPIHDLALKHKLKVMTPKTLKDAKEQENFSKLKADAALVVAYGLILPKNIIESTKYGCVNIHPSLLPKWRGATPIQSTLWAGDAEIGVSIIKMDEGVDSGDIILQEGFEIGEGDNYGNLAPKLAEMGANMALEALKYLDDGGVEFAKQSEFEVSYSKKIQKSDALIDFNKDAIEVLNQIRALSGFMTAYFEVRGERVKIFDARLVSEDEVSSVDGEEDGLVKGRDALPGEIVSKDFVIRCEKGAIRPILLQKPGKKPMRVGDFLRGFRF